MKKIYMSALAAVLIGGAMLSAKADSPALFSIGKDKYTYEDLNRAFKKSKTQDVELNSLSCDSLKNYIKMYYSYKLKVKDAESRKYENDPAVKLDLENNRKIVAESFYFDRQIVEPNVDIMSERRKVEKQISYMLFALPPAPATDTAAAYKKAEAALARLNSGENFATVASEMSDDETTAKRGGRLDEYVSSGKMERRIEDAVYGLQVGEYYNGIVSLPKIGYFIVKLDNSKPREFVKFSHILASRTAQPDDSLGIKAKAKIDSVYAHLKTGSTFEGLAKDNSDDGASAQNGGRFDDWYSCSDGFSKDGGTVIPEFEKTIFNLKDGEYSAPIETLYGWHIIRRDSTRSINITEEREKMRQLYRRIYFENDKKALVDKLKLQDGFKINQNTLNKLLASVDTNKTDLDSNWTANIPQDLKKQTLFSYEKKDYKLSEVIDLMNSPGQFRGLPTNAEGFKKAIRYITDPKAINKATKDLEKTNPEFKELINEFRDGTLLFKAETDEVWSKMQFDTNMAKQYYNSHKADFFTAKTYDVQEVMLIKESDAKEMYRRLKSGEISFDEAAEKFTQRAGFRENKGKLYAVNPKKHRIAGIVDEQGLREGDFTTPQFSDNGYSIIKVNKINNPKQKTFEESVQELAPIVQDQMQAKRTNDWIDRIKKKFNFRLNEAEINKLCK
ncbi:MAG: peptidylprolyl isomerase [Candidatus Kapabacteria bacterium]|nr:peptidylprolyl isomerase [Candidatus Kapabacteria bacterium]